MQDSSWFDQRMELHNLMATYSATALMKLRLKGRRFSGKTGPFFLNIVRWIDGHYCLFGEPVSPRFVASQQDDRVLHWAKRVSHNQHRDSLRINKI